ncbi:hypothetical protein [Metabacillus sp. FJAT-52054]|uniref:Uncharacterized protein n=1 Tax=Metabacillus sediminis TaxID=3117746 RepID=A0ABZ2NJN0_9BACI
MKKIMAILLAGSLLIIAAGFEQTPNETRFRPTEFGNLFLKGEYEKIYNQTNDEFKAQVPLDDFMHVSGEFNKGVSKYRLESTILLSGNKQYIWTDQSKTKGISVIAQADRTIAGLNLLPLELHSQTDKNYTRNKYTMPVKNRWLVY